MNSNTKRPPNNLYSGHFMGRNVARKIPELEVQSPKQKNARSLCLYW